MAFFNPADYEARRRTATQSFGATGAMNAYANFLSQQRGTRERTNMMDQYDKAQPQITAGYARRGLQGPNVQSGIFARGLQDFAKQRARGLQEFDQGQLESQRGYDLGEAQRLEAFRNQLADMESEKAQTIADTARQLFANRVGAV
tara:strand:- start:84 stop:521 length:438 start_codon:yes stop_codon:yes gene_type:complete